MKKLLATLSIAMLSSQAVLATAPSELLNKSSQTVVKEDVSAPVLALTMKTLQSAEQDVAATIIKTTSILHRLERALMIDKVIEKATAVPSSVYIGATGVVLGGFVVGLSGKTVEGIGSSVKHSGESFGKMKHQFQSVQNAIAASGNSAESSGRQVEVVGQAIVKFGEAWIDATKLIVDNPSSRKSADAFIQYLVKPAQKLLEKTGEFSSNRMNDSFDILAAVNKFLLHRVAFFAERTAVNVGESSAGTSMAAASSALAYMAWTKGKSLYDVHVKLSDEQIQAAVMQDPQLDAALEQITTEISSLFGLSADKKAELKEVIANDLVVQKIKEYRVEAPQTDDVNAWLPWNADSIQKNRAEFEETLREKYNLTEQEIQKKLTQYDEMAPKAHQLKDVDPAIGSYDILDSVEKVLDQDQLAALTALKSMHDSSAAVDSISDSMMQMSSREALASVSDQVKILIAIKEYIKIAKKFEDVFAADAIKEVDALLLDIDKKIAAQKAKLELLK